MCTKVNKKTHETCLTCEYIACIFKISTKRAQGGENLNKEVIAEKLIKLRGEKSRDTVAKACGISVSALAMYEQGERIPRDDIKIRLAKYYESSVEFIFFEQNEHKTYS